MGTTLNRWLTISIEPGLNDWPYCERCRKVVDIYMRRLDWDALRGVKHDPKVMASPSLNRLYIVVCHGVKGHLQVDYAEWRPAQRPQDSGALKG